MGKLIQRLQNLPSSGLCCIRYRTNSGYMDTLKTNGDKKTSNFVRYFWGSVFLLITAINFYTLTVQYDNSTLWTVIIFGVISLLCFQPHILSPFIPSKDNRQSASKFFLVLIIGILCYFIIQWAVGYTGNITSTPLAQISLSDIGRLIVSIFVSFFAIKFLVGFVIEQFK